MAKKIGLVIIGILLIIQLIPTNLPEVSTVNADDLLANNSSIPTNIEAMLRSSCYDCHSNETVYPWYSYVAPVSFLVSRDTREGRKHLNFSDWQSLSKPDKAEALDELAEEVEGGDMPMKIYPITHADAKLSDEDRKAIITWAEDFADKLYDE
jgi:hypothetical protein